MKTLLRIDASVRHRNSYSRAMGDYFVARWKSKNRDGRIILRDLETQPVPHLTNGVVNAFLGYDDCVEGIELSDKLIEEVNVSDEVLITCPMYNFNIPSTLKSYIDHVVRVNKTFRYSSEQGFEGLIKNKRAFIVTTMGGRRVMSGANEAFEEYLLGILSFIGITDSSVISLDGTADKAYADSLLSQVQEKIGQVIN